MARNPPKPPPVGSPQIEKDTAIGLLEQQITRGNELLSKRPLDNDSYSQWELLTSNFLEKAFGQNSPNVKTVTDVGKYGAFSINAGPEYWEKRRADSLKTQITRIEGLARISHTPI